MVIKVGELARRTGMTVRTLHHYDAIGLLSPNQRNNTGVRLYDHNDVIRLHRIQAMKVLGYGLSDIRSALADEAGGVVDVTRKHVRALETRALQAQSLADGLNALLNQLSEGRAPSQDEWLDSLEMLAMYQRHLTATEVKTVYQPNDGVPNTLDNQWSALVEEVSEAIKAQWAMDEPRVNELAWRWVHLVIARTGNDPKLAIKLNQLHQTERRAHALAGVGPVMIAWIGQAIAHARTAVFARYLTPEQTAQLRQRQIAAAKDLDVWPKLMMQVQECMDAKLAPHSAPVQALANTWQMLFRKSYCGDDADMESNIRAAFANEPDLSLGVGVNDALMAFMHKALARLERVNITHQPVKRRYPP